MKRGKWIPFERVLGDTSELRMIEKLLAMPSFEFSVSELARMTGLSRLSVYRVVRNFENWQMITALQRGKRTRYMLNGDSKLVRELYGFNHELVLALSKEEGTLSPTEATCAEEEREAVYLGRFSMDKLGLVPSPSMLAAMDKYRPVGAVA